LLRARAQGRRSHLRRRSSHTASARLGAMSRHLIASAALALVAMALGASAGSGAVDAVVDSALAVDDQCEAGDELCAVNALQMRGAKKAQEYERARAASARVFAHVSAQAHVNASASCAQQGCDANFRGDSSCQCNAACIEYGNCCNDHASVCRSHYEMQRQAGSSMNGQCSGKSGGFRLNMKAEGRDFINHFTFVEIDDVHGAHQFTSKEEAKRQSTIHLDGDVVQLKFGGLRPPSYHGEAFKRYAVNIHTNKAWDPENGFLAVMHYRRIPYGCGVWPSFWAMNSDKVWPGGGELDIMEFASHSPNKVTFHIAGKCELDRQKMAQCAPVGRSLQGNADCETNYFINKMGCMPNQRQPDGEFFSKNPGVMAAEWTSEHIIIYHIPEASIPQDLNQERPDTSGWQKWVVAYLPLQPNCKDTIGPQELVLNMQLCGDWAGGTFGTDKCSGLDWNYLHGCRRGLSQSSDCCTKYVTDHRQDEFLKSMSWDIRSLKVFTRNGGGSHDSGTFRRGGSPP